MELKNLSVNQKKTYTTPSVYFISIDNKNISALGLKINFFDRKTPSGFYPEGVLMELAVGGDDGNRTHVRKPLGMTFFVDSLLFEILR